jgi:ABC-2 type transport system permease protein
MVEGAAYKPKRNRQRDLTQLVLSVLILLLINYVGSFLFHRFDLTSEKRYTLSPESKKTAESLKGIAFFKVYLDGKLPAGFIRLRDETKEMLDEFRAYSGNKIQYEFINPSADPDESHRQDFFKQLEKEGLNPTNLEVRDNSGSSQQTIFPGAILNYQGSEEAFDILKNQDNVDPQTALNNSIEALEYTIDNAIHKLSIPFKPTIGIIQGHGELDSIHLAGAISALSEYYNVKLVTIAHKLHALRDYQAIIIAKPDSVDERDKFIIDQFIMNGGKALWCVDPLYEPMDSLRLNSLTFAYPANTNLDDQLFDYGVRLNTNLIMDYQCSVIPLKTGEGYNGQNPDIRLYPWFFNPLISPTSNNYIVKNLNFIELQLASTIDTVGAQGIKKTILLATSKECKLLNSPVRVSFGYAKIQPDEKQFNQSYQPVAVLLEGKFQSLYKNRLTGTMDTAKAIGFKADGKQTAMIVVSDGDVIANDVRLGQTGEKMAYPLGYDRFARTQFGNKDFIVNCMNYLCGDSTLLAIRAKQLQLRLLDAKKAHLFKTQWQIINMLVPVAIVIFMGVILTWVRKERYAK